jgi:hypothetical protein
MRIVMGLLLLVGVWIALRALVVLPRALSGRGVVPSNGRLQLLAFILAVALPLFLLMGSWMFYVSGFYAGIAPAPLPDRFEQFRHFRLGAYNDDVPQGGRFVLSTTDANPIVSISLAKVSVPGGLWRSDSVHLEVDGATVMSEFTSKPADSIPESMLVGRSDTDVLIGIRAALQVKKYAVGNALQAKSALQAAIPVRIGQDKFVVTSKTFEHSFTFAIVEPGQFEALRQWQAYDLTVDYEQQARSRGMWITALVFWLVSIGLWIGCVRSAKAATPIGRYGVSARR